MNGINAVNSINPVTTPMYTQKNSNETGNTEKTENTGRVTKAEMLPEMIQRELQRIKESSEASESGTADLARASKIFSRILAGDIVPDKDDKWLLENYPEMHMKAWMLRREKEEPVKHDSVLEDDKNTATSSSGEVTSSIPTASNIGGNSTPLSVEGGEISAEISLDITV